MNIINLTEALDWEKEQKPKVSPNLRAGFDCEEASLNNFLSKFARQADEQNSARTWVSLDKKQSKIAGYVNTLNENAESFYKEYGFTKVGSTNKMIISTQELF